ncbi:Uncharacterized protein PECH_000755, partial [Penicillium ucsense]
MLLSPLSSHLLFSSIYVALFVLACYNLVVSVVERPAAVMFQRLRDAIDSRIAEEQARQKTAQDNLSRSGSSRRPLNNNSSPGRPSRPRRNTGTPVRGPDPKEFEGEFAIGEDEDSSRAATPRLETPEDPSEKATKPTETEPGEDDGEKGKAKLPVAESSGKDLAPAGEKTPSAQDKLELPVEVKAKLRRLDKLEGRYIELLKAYRSAHARVLSIEPFEAALRENTPLTSIAEPKALTEYLNQMSLKSDMVIDELKRVTTDRDDYKNKLEEAQRETKAAHDELTGLKSQKETSSQETNQKAENKEGEANEEFFSFDNEVPRLEGELKAKQEEVDTLKTEVDKLKKDLFVARESTEGMVQSLETSTRELVELREGKDKLDAEIDSLKSAKEKEVGELKAKLADTESSLREATEEVDQLKTDLQGKTEVIERLQTEALEAEKPELDPTLLAQLEEAKKAKDATDKRLDVVQSLVDTFKSQLREAESQVSALKKEIDQKTEDSSKLQQVVNFVDGGLKGIPAWDQAKTNVVAGMEASFEEIRNSLAPPQNPTEPTSTPAVVEIEAPAPVVGGSGAGGKKKNKKKKKGGKAAEEEPKTKEASVVEVATAAAEPGVVDELTKQIETLTQQLSEKESAVDRLSAKLKGEEDLKEEIESLRDDLINVGQEHVESKDKIKELTAEKSALQETITKLEKELAEVRTSNASDSADSQKLHDDLKEEFERLRTRSASLETDLSAAQQLAATRFKDLTDLREKLEKVQPELRSLRAESSELKTMKDILASKNGELRKLEASCDELRAELKVIKTTVSERDSEVNTLNKKIRQETDSRLKAEEALTVAQSDLRSSEARKQEAITSRERTLGELSKAQEGLKSTRVKVREMEEQISQLTKEVGGLKEEIQLKTAQHASAQSLIGSMRDQTTEVATQMKEVKERCESLEEELADAHRLLNERTREGETMRRLINDIETRSEAKVRDFKERMEAAVEERDRAEDEASTQARRRAREMEDLKAKVREAERALRTAEEDRENLVQSQKDWRRRRDELESQSERSTQELEEVRQAMASLREQLDESERQVRDLEKEKIELRRSVEETSNRLEKLRRSHKTLGEDLRLRGMESGRQSSRSSIDSNSRRPSGVLSPPPPDRSASSRRSETPSSAGPGVGAGSIDYMYLKNVLLQFMEQKDKNYQKQLIPVLGMLLHFDR